MFINNPCLSIPCLVFINYPRTNSLFSVYQLSLFINSLFSVYQLSLFSVYQHPCLSIPCLVFINYPCLVFINIPV